jgi:pantoate kinase
MKEQYHTAKIFRIRMPAPARAFSPGHISGYFKRIAGATPRATGSIGAGVVISEGVTACAEPGERTFVVIRRLDRDNRLIEQSTGSPPVEYALAGLGVQARITTSCRLPIGAGFGMSAAALLASITAADHLLGLGLHREEIAARAHEAEVVHRTGLGDVAACQGGGFDVRKQPGIHAEIARMFPADCKLCALSFGPIPTPSVLDSPDAMARVAAAFPEGYPASVADLFRLSRRFTERSGLITGDVRAVLEACDEDGVPASMTMLGNGVFACGDRARGTLARFGEVYEFTVARAGVHLLEDQA